jgi:hypothetical protein
MLVPLLLACAPKPKDSPEPPPITPSCDEEYLEPDTLDWDDPGPGGVSAQDVFAFAVGPHAFSLAWDDGTTTDATLTITPGSAIQQRAGEQASCPVAVTGLADWALTSADGMLAATGSGRWEVGDTSLPAAGISISDTLDEGELGLAPMNAGSMRDVRLYLAANGTFLNFKIEETWPLTADTNRLCVRGAIDSSAIACQDTNENNGPD